MVRSLSFAPAVPRNARVLLLGSLPGQRSLIEQRYYAHPTNQFWKLMGEVIHQPLVENNYETRLAMLNRAGIGLWDVVRSAHRQGSLDSSLRDIETHDLRETVRQLPQLSAIAFNGQKAAAIGLRSLGSQPSVVVHVLPSSSAAYTIPFAQKSAQWMKLRDYLHSSP